MRIGAVRAVGFDELRQIRAPATGANYTVSVGGPKFRAPSGAHDTLARTILRGSTGAAMSRATRATERRAQRDSSGTPAALAARSATGRPEPIVVGRRAKVSCASFSVARNFGTCLSAISKAGREAVDRQVDRALRSHFGVAR